MTTYILPSIVTVHGTFNVTLYSEYAGLTKPTDQTFLSIGTLKKVAKISLSEQEFETLKITLRDDYSTYTTYGFWYKISQGNWRLKITLTEPINGEMFFFYGKPLTNSIVWTEYAIGTINIRTAEIELIALTVDMFDVLMSTLLGSMRTNSIDTGVAVLNQPDHVIKLMHIFACLLYESGLNPSYSVTDVSFVYATREFKFFNVTDDEMYFNNLYVVTGWYTTVPNVLPHEFDSTPHADYFGSYYSFAREFVSDLLKSFGLVMITDYDIASSRHLIKLKQLWNTEAGFLTFGSREKKPSTICENSDLQISSARAATYKDTTSIVWFSKNYYSDTAQTGTPPSYVSFDLDFRCPFIIKRNGTVLESLALYGKITDVNGSNGNPDLIDDCQYYDHKNTAYAGTINNNTLKMQNAAAGYQYMRLQNEWRVINRTYAKITSYDNSDGTESVKNLNLMKRVQINDGIASANYYANKIEVDVEKSELLVMWIQDT